MGFWDNGHMANYQKWSKTIFRTTKVSSVHFFHYKVVVSAFWDYKNVHFFGYKVCTVPFFDYKNLYCLLLRPQKFIVCFFDIW
jgi:hypothetical protein